MQTFHDEYMSWFCRFLLIASREYYSHCIATSSSPREKQPEVRCLCMCSNKKDNYSNEQLLTHGSERLFTKARIYHCPEIAPSKIGFEELVWSQGHPADPSSEHCSQQPQQFSSASSHLLAKDWKYQYFNMWSGFHSLSSPLTAAEVPQMCFQST